MLLALDTATTTASIALYNLETNTLVAEMTWQARRRHTQDVLPTIESMMRQMDVTPQQLTVFEFSENGFSMLEDGLYISRACFDDSACRDRSTRFLRASLGSAINGR